MRDLSREPTGDRRLAQRKNISLKVYLSGKRWSGSGHTRDLSRRGVFVETSWQGIPFGSLVDLTFVHRQLKIIKLYRYSAVVVRRNDRGLGLRFCWAPNLDRIDSVKLPG